MSYPVYYVPAGDILPIFFASYGKTNGESITLSGLAVTDIEIYKDGSVTQRASDAGYTLLDTDGTDFDAITGIHGISIDTGDNTDAGFYTVGAWFHVVVSSVTIDGQTVNFVAAAFRIMPAESAAGTPKVDVSHISGSAVSTTSAQIGVNVVQISTDATAADNAEAFFDGTGYAGTNNVIPTVTTVTNGVNVAAGGIGAGAHAAAELNAIADAVLDRNMATGTDSGTDSTAVRTPRQAFRLSRNKVTNAAGTLTVYKENDTTVSWTGAVGTTAGDPITSVDPA